MHLSLRKFKFLFHLLYWVAHLSIMYYVFSYAMDSTSALKRTLTSGGVHIFAVYLNLWVLFPIFYIKKRYLFYTILLIAVLLDISLLRWYLEFKVFDLKLSFMPEVHPVMQYVFTLVTNTPIIFLSVFYAIGENSLKFQRKVEELEKHKLEAELKFLKSQINPHFLFNTLNNIYSHAYQKSDKTAELIMKLSEMMRYFLYDCQESLVLLSKEIEYINNYIELVKLKDEDAQVLLEISGDNNLYQISPLILSPFLENAIKHSNLNDINEGFVDIKLKIEDGFLFFTVKNTKKKKGNTTLIPGGIGLVNVKQRLEYLYPEKHMLTIEDNEEVYNVELKLELNK